jgi:signal recognition particle GTPase
MYSLVMLLQEVLLVLDGTTGLNMLQQAREFNDVSATRFAPNSLVVFLYNKE